MAVIVEPFGARHDRAAFSCGRTELDEWFKQRAGQDERRKVARVFVAADSDLGLVGYYSLGAFTLSLDDPPATLARKFPRRDMIPAALIGRLARDARVRGKGVGELLLADALRRVLGVSRSLAVFAIVVDAKDDRAAAFYEGFGFRRFPLHPDRLFLPASLAAAALERM